MSYYKESRDELLAELERVCKACNTTLDEVENSDDPDVATPSQVAAVCLQYERDMRDQARDEMMVARAEVRRLRDWLIRIETDGVFITDRMNALQLRRWASEALFSDRYVPEPM